MCTYNGARFVEQQLDSIVNQTYRNLEIVVADDGSTDDTVAIVRRFQQRDRRIRLLEGVSNLGFIGNFARALSACTGDQIALADQDDVWLPEKIMTLCEQLGDNLLIYSRVQMIDAEGNQLQEVFPRVNRLDGACALSLLVDNCVTGHACLIQRELRDLALPFPPGVKAHDQWLALVAAGLGRMKASESVLSLYRKHGANVLLNKKKKRSVSRAKQNMQRDERIASVAVALDSKKVLSPDDARLMREFVQLLMRNRVVVYNLALSRFLKRNQDKFLALYRDPVKARRKLCRGDFYFRIVPFA